MDERRGEETEVVEDREKTDDEGVEKDRSSRGRGLNRENSSIRLWRGSKSRNKGREHNYPPSQGTQRPQIERNATQRGETKE